MTILALEFSSAQRSVAVLESSDLRLRSVVTETNPRGSNGMTLIDSALTQAEIEPRNISVVAVGLGPGSYAGIRSAIAIAQGWELGLGTRLVGISSVDVLTLEAQTRGMFGPIAIVIDAQRSELYQARFEITPAEIRALESLRIGPIDALDKGFRLAGPGASELVQSATDLFPGAHALAKLAVRDPKFCPGEKLEPIYLREVAFVKTAPSRLSFPPPIGALEK